MQIKYPYQINGNGQTAESGYAAHIREMIEQLLFTVPGERVNRPEFGAGLMQLVFAPNSLELASSTQFLIQGALQQYMGDLVQTEEVNVEVVDAILRVTIRYVILVDQSSRTESFELTT
ncbi:MAG: GPW/gp25 family protein [Leptospirales bacterium]|jgi:phage baseplate assembly protein W